MPRPIYNEKLEMALQKTGKFRTYTLQRSEPEATVSDCSKMGADILLMGVFPVADYTIHQRIDILRRMRRELPDCKLVIFVDDEVSERVNRKIKSLKQSGMIDAFLYASASFSHLESVLEAL